MITPCYIPDASQSGAVRPPLAGWFARTYGGTSGYFGLKCPPVGPSIDWTMPTADAAGCLQSNGAGTLSFGTPTTDLTNAVILAPGSSTRNVVQPSGPTVVPFICKGAVSQTGDFQEWQDSNGVVLGSLSANSTGVKLVLQGRPGLDRGATLTPDISSGSLIITTSIGAGIVVEGVSIGSSSTAGMTLGTSSITIGRLAPTPFTFSHGAYFSDVAPRAVTLAAADAWSSATTNTTGGGMTVKGGAAGGNNAAGGTLDLIAGMPSGSGTTGSVRLRTGGAALGSGSTLNTPVTVLEAAPGDAHGMLAFYGVTPVARQLLATGASHTVDDVITALQNLGLVRQT